MPDEEGMLPGMQSDMLQDIVAHSGEQVVELGMLTVVMNQAVQLLERILSMLTKSSAYLQGVLKMFERAFMYFMKPFADFLAIALRPLARALLNMAVEFTKFMRAFLPTREAREAAGVGGIAGAITGGAIGAVIAGPVGAFIGSALGFFGGTLIGALVAKIPEFVDWLGRLGEKMWTSLKEWWSNVVDVVGGFGSWMWTNITEGIGDMVSSIGGFGSWLWREITSAIGSLANWIGGFGTWLWSEITTAIGDLATWVGGFGSWLWEEITTAIGNLADWVGGFGTWLWEAITGAIGDLGTWLGGFGRWLWREITKAIRGRWKWEWPSKQFGTPYIPQTGLYMLHKGEAVIPAGGTSKTVIPIIMGMTAGIDIEATIREATRNAEREMRRRGLA